MRVTVLVLFVFFTTVANCQKGKTFRIEKLSKPSTYLSTKSSEKIYESLILSDIKIFRNDIDFPFNIIAKSQLPDSLVFFGYHPFFKGMSQAYADHRPFVLSPDMVWLLISQGFAQHINLYPENVRQQLSIDYSGKLSLIVETDEIKLDDPNSPWEKIFPGFTEQIARNTSDKFVELLLADFSTSTIIEKVASEITIMKVADPFFEYIVATRFVCGIPKITLQGTTGDWQKILDKTKQLEKYGLAWWTKELVPVLEEFVKASKGEIRKEFWRNMFRQYSKNRPCGGPVTMIDGWMVKFFPYDKNGNVNNLKELNDCGNLPEEMVTVDVKHFCMDTGIFTPLELWAGFVGLEQNMKNFSLTPKIAWMIRKKDIHQVGLKQKFDSDNELQGGIAIRVKEIPVAMLSMSEITRLEVAFTDKIVIPDRLAKVKIGKLVLSGEIDELEIERIRHLFPDTKLIINNTSVNL